MRPDDRSYQDSHEWARLQDDRVFVGITDFAIEQLGELVFLELPKPGTRLTRGQTFGEIESVKAVSDLNSPVTGEVVAVHDSLPDELEKLQADPWDEGWLLQVKVDGPAALEGLLDAAAYNDLVASES